MTALGRRLLIHPGRADRPQLKVKPPLPAVLAPRIRAISFAKDGGYRFRAITAHPWLGLIFAYSGRL